MLLRFDPFREFDRLFDAAANQSASVPRQMPMNAFRKGDELHVSFDLPGVSADSIDLTVERNQLTLTAERRHERSEGEEWLVAERPVGRFTRQLMLGENLDTENIKADYHDGVLEVTIPVAQEAKPRKVSIGGKAETQPIEATSSVHSANDEQAVSA
jgi:HSP20 family protein